MCQAKVVRRSCEAAEVDICCTSSNAVHVVESQVEHFWQQRRAEKALRAAQD